jgi:hypothetical protein
MHGRTCADGGDVVQADLSIECKSRAERLLVSTNTSVHDLFTSHAIVIVGTHQVRCTQSMPMRGQCA